MTTINEAVQKVRQALDQFATNIGNTQIEDIGRVIGIAFGIAVIWFMGVDKLRIDAEAAAATLHAAFHDVAHAKFAANLPCISRLAFIGEGGMAGDDEGP